MLRKSARLLWPLLGAFGRLGGYATSMLLLAATSLLLIPALVAREGGAGWGGIAFGQAVGSIGAVVVAYGWQVSGPALVATADPARRRREYLDSLRLKASLAAPVGAVCVVLALVLGREHAWLSAAGAVASASIGLTASWVFVGLERPGLLLALETLPRCAGTTAGIIALQLGSRGGVALLLQLCGMLAAVAASTGWILRSTRTSARLEPRRLRDVARSQGHGLGASTASAAYLASPVVLIFLVAPAVQPAYALVDRIQRQLAVGLGPAVSVAQGWAPRASSREALRQRALRATLAAGAFAGLLVVGVALTGPLLVQWLGDGRIGVSDGVRFLMGAFVGLALFETVLAQAVLPALDRVRLVARTTIASAAIGLPATVLGALHSVELALAGLLSGLALRVVVELWAIFSFERGRRQGG